jgi:hypothetical protein
MLKMALSDKGGTCMSDESRDVRVVGLGDYDGDGDELTRMLRAVERIADAVGSIHELAVRVTPNTPAAAAMARLQLTPHDVAYMREIYERAATHRTAFVTVPIEWLTALLRVVDDPAWVP